MKSLQTLTGIGRKKNKTKKKNLKATLEVRK